MYCRLSMLMFVYWLSSSAHVCAGKGGPSARYAGLVKAELVACEEQGNGPATPTTDNRRSKIEDR